MTQEVTQARETTTEQPQRKSTRVRPRGTVLDNQAERYEAARRVLKEEGITIQHFRLQTIAPEGFLASHTGGITVAFRQLNTDSFVEVATSLCSEKDVYDRKVGTILATEQFANMRRIRIPLFGAHPADAIEHMFRGYTTFIDQD